MVQSLSLFSQENKTIPDTIVVRQDLLVTDTILKNLKKISLDAIDKQVTYNAEGLIKNDLVNKKTPLLNQRKSIMVRFR